MDESEKREEKREENNRNKRQPTLPMEQKKRKRFCGKCIHEYEGFASALHSIQMSNTHMNFAVRFHLRVFQAIHNTQTLTHCHSFIHSLHSLKTSAFAQHTRLTDEKRRKTTIKEIHLEGQNKN